MYFDKNNTYITEDKSVIFDLDKMDFYELNSSYYKKFQDIYYNGINNDKVNDKEYKEIFDTFFNNRTSYIKHNKRLKELDYIKIHVSNTCNLACKYCYANQGNYGSQDKIMTRTTAKRISDIIISKFSNISNITFFGGEPLLGIDAIEEICKNLSEKNIAYNIITNLTLIDDKVIEVLNKYNIKITVSVDGPKEINDFNRVFKNGKGTYDVIAKNINILQRKGMIPICIEGTYTENSAAKYTRQQIASMLYDDLSIKTISILNEKKSKQENTIQDISINEDELKKEVNFTFDNIAANRFIFLDDIFLIFSYFFSKTFMHYFCRAGIEFVSININGDIYPCHLYINKVQYNMGNIFSNEDLENENKYTCVRNKMMELNKFKIEKCSKCIARFWCKQCLGSQLTDDGEMKLNFSEFECNLRKKKTVLVLEKIAELQKKGLLNEIIKTIYEIQSEE
ncbi:uncharacterized protein SAMN02745135_01570 [Caloranaerobacter azorensis DSM 13643]|uniref:Radical SAM core domain-containing protein n=1 Tax=Caloranaerobacter azorensis DSM 13643 TaxID=1121264 RepID=A0A1M5UTI2_9FIRM|nr:radical SAM protein [Caloranaerobacter azorensis]SHH66210.1 uncharacterized protein SAMN02745135_01570 [Caloranaerobacter azorensis DSM 13643]